MAQRGRPRKKVAEAKTKTTKTKVKTTKAKVETKIKKEPKVASVKEPIEETIPTQEPTNDMDASVNESIDISDVDYVQPEPKVMSYNPFAESVEEREYRSVKVATSPLIDEISEPRFERPSFEDLVNENKEQVIEDGVGEAENSFAQEEIQNLPPKQQEDAAKGLVEQALGLYTLGCKGLGTLAKIRESKVDDLAKEGMIDMSIKVPIDPYTSVTIPDIINGFNSEVGDAFDVSEDFKDEVRPIMTRVFAKRGWGMSDEQQLMFAFGMDFVQKGAILMQLKKQGDVQLQKFIEMTDYKNSNQNVNFVSPDSEPQQRRSRRPAPAPEDMTEAPVVNESIEIEEDILVQAQPEASSMVGVINPDIKINKHDLDQVDVDNV